MADFVFGDVLGAGGSSGTMTGTMGGPTDPAFTFSFKASSSTTAGSGDEIVLLVSSLAYMSFTGTFAFSDPAYYFQDFSLNAGTFGLSDLTLSVYTTSGGTFVMTNPLSSSFAGNVTGFKITGSGTSFGYVQMASVTSAAINCFAPGTLIATPSGSKPVEHLSQGDLVLKPDGSVTHVRWLGRHKPDAMLQHPARINPVRISAGALGQGLPERDLVLSPDHAIALDGYLVNAGAMLNGDSITQDRGMLDEDFAYYHVETDAHELILAEGIAAETYIDYASADGFENSDDRPPQGIQEMPLPRVSTARMLPDVIKSRIAPNQNTKTTVGLAA